MSCWKLTEKSKLKDMGRPIWVPPTVPSHSKCFWRFQALSYLQEINADLCGFQTLTDHVVMTTGNSGAIGQRGPWQSSVDSFGLGVMEWHENVLQHCQGVAGESDSFTTFRKKVTLLKTFSVSDPCPGESFWSLLTDMAVSVDVQGMSIKELEVLNGRLCGKTEKWRSSIWQDESCC